MSETGINALNIDPLLWILIHTFRQSHYSGSDSGYVIWIVIDKMIRSDIV